MSDDLVNRLRDAHANSTQRIVGSNIFNDAAQALTEARAEIERLTEQALVKDHAIIEAAKLAKKLMTRAVAAESELSTLRARVREVVGPFAEMRQALELISANKPGDELLDERAIFQTWGLKDTPTSKQITLGHLRAARQLNEDLK